ncbi:MAG: hypothetical protein HXX20_00895 [Chloroflexi bacterium]|nr:hypothetical protein [Chloroflexota bacterium]
MVLEASKVDLKLETTSMTVVAGDSAEQEITLVNLTTLPDNFDLKVEGLPSGWYSFSKPSVNLFPNWNETVTFKVELSPKVRPNQYSGRIIVTSRSQPGVSMEVQIEIVVLAPLKLEARLQPHQATGFKANYNLILRNRSMSDVIMTLQLSADNPYCVGLFTPPEIKIAPSEAQVVKFKVQLAPKTPADQAQQAQPFEVQIQPKWVVGDQTVSTPDLLVDGEYKHQSKWIFIARHPFFVAGAVLLVLTFLLWVIILSFIQNSLLLLTEKLPPAGVVRGSLRVEENIFSSNLQAKVNPLAAFVTMKVRFIEENQQVEISLKSFLVTDKMIGQLKVDPEGDLSFTAGRLVPDTINGGFNFKAEPNRSNDLPWMFIPPNKVVDRLNLKLKTWLISQNQQGMVKAEIEGSTLYLRLQPCPAADPIPAYCKLPNTSNTLGIPNLPNLK